VIVMDENGRSDFGALCSAIRWQPGRLVFVAFDLMYLDGEDLRFQPLLDRRQRLQELIGDHDGPIQFSHHVAGLEGEFYAAVEKFGLVSKRAGAPYRSGRGTNWLKVKCYQVAGVLRERGRPAIAYMVTPDKERRYVGGAFINLNDKMRERLWARVKAGAKPVKGADAEPGTEWLKRG
jgi:bifunctional non-homologous end joining protein LigD